MTEIEILRDLIAYCGRRMAETGARGYYAELQKELREELELHENT